ncbi:MAG: dTDP-4-dehydrorhamnose reductase [Candidatus Cloacimonetes bacterium 4572_55]|nr:MAG: dTDP-4-dehydrorhamnose reductase [Candidatus Cloacimonetes bacterium 4572_55]
MIWIIGSTGMLGKQICMELRRLKIPYYGTDREVDITRSEALEKFSEGKSVRQIVNCAAYTDVDRAEEEPEYAEQINGRGAKNIAQIAAKLDATMIHFSTDFVFDGQKTSPYREDDEPNPLSVYGQTKLSGERKIIQVSNHHSCWKKYYIIRISWLYGVCGKNFVKTIIRLCNERKSLNVIHDQIGSPTYCAPLAQNIVHLLHTTPQKFGIYHYSDQAAISWFNFAVEIQKLGVEFGLIKKEIPIRPISAEEYPMPATRPPYSVMDNGNIQRNFGFRDFLKERKKEIWRENLRQFFVDFSESS